MAQQGPRAAPAKVAPASADAEATTVCPNCGETQQLAKVKGCVRCLRCGFKFDCNGW